MTGRPIAFITDLGLHDDAVGMCKGMMLQISPSSPIVDITHAVTPFDVNEGAQYLQDQPDFFPNNTVFCCVVYPETGVGPTVAIENDRGQIYVGPDNGVFTFALEASGIRAAYHVQNPRVIRQPPTPSFYGRDVVVACAAHIAAGFPIHEVGPGVQEIVQLPGCRVVSRRDEVYGKIMLIDKNFGNVWTNVTREHLVAAGLDGADFLSIRLGDVAYTWPLVATFGDVPKGQPLAYFNSRDRLAFGLNQGSLAAQIQAVRGLDLHLTQCLEAADYGEARLERQAI